MEFNRVGEGAALRDTAVILLMFVVLAWGGRWSGYRTAELEVDARWQQTLVEKSLGRWVIDPATGEKSFEVGEAKKE
jgi:hypothetical protein